MEKFILIPQKEKYIFLRAEPYLSLASQLVTFAFVTVAKSATVLIQRNCYIFLEQKKKSTLASTHLTKIRKKYHEILKYFRQADLVLTSILLKWRAEYLIRLNALFLYAVETDIIWTPFLSKEVRLKCYLIFLEFYKCLTRERKII